MRARWISTDGMLLALGALLALGVPGATPVVAQERGTASGPGGSSRPTAITGRDARSRALYLSLIENLRKSGQVHAALAHLDAFDRQFPRAEDAAMLRGNCLVDIADYAGATAVFQRLTQGRQAAAAFAGLGRIAALAERWPDAAAHYARAVHLAPTAPAYLSDYGFVLLRAGRAGEAVFRLRQAAQLAPGDLRARNNLILALAASGDEPGARRLLASVTDPTQRAQVEAELAKAKVAASAAATPAS